MKFLKCGELVFILLVYIIMYSSAPTQRIPNRILSIQQRSNSYCYFVKRPTERGFYGISSSAYFAFNFQYFRAHRTKYTAHNQYILYALSINRTAHYKLYSI